MFYANRVRGLVRSKAMLMLVILDADEVRGVVQFSGVTGAEEQGNAAALDCLETAPGENPDSVASRETMEQRPVVEWNYIGHIVSDAGLCRGLHQV